MSSKVDPVADFAIDTAAEAMLKAIERGKKSAYVRRWGDCKAVAVAWPGGVFADVKAPARTHPALAKLYKAVLELRNSSRADAYFAASFVECLGKSIGEASGKYMMEVDGGLDLSDIPPVEYTGRYIDAAKSFVKFEKKAKLAARMEASDTSFALGLIALSRSEALRIKRSAPFMRKATTYAALAVLAAAALFSLSISPIAALAIAAVGAYIYFKFRH